MLVEELVARTAGFSGAEVCESILSYQYNACCSSSSGDMLGGGEGLHNIIPSTHMRSRVK